MQKKVSDKLEINPQYSEAYYNLGNVLNLQGKKSKAESNYYICLKLNPNHFEAIINLGVTLVEKKKFEDSVAIFKRALSINPNCYFLYNYLGNSYIQLGRINKALKVLTEAIEKNMIMMKHGIIFIILYILFILQNRIVIKNYLLF